ncbi:hypothetical protein MASR2M8_25060 [Opitutaceae bacterium]
MSDRLYSVLAALLRLPARALLGLIWVYQRTLSPVIPVVMGPYCGCRFHPTCSHYAAEAVRTHGALLGVGLALRRIAKCNPLHEGGLDPVPPASGLRQAGRAAARRAGPVCVRA